MDQPTLDQSAQTIAVANRKHRRRHKIKRIEITPVHLFGRYRTGTPDWFKGIKAQQEAKRILKATKTAKLVPLVRGIDIIAPHFKTVYALATTSKEQLLKIPGVGPATLQRVYAYLSQNRVPVSWKP